MSNLAGSYRIDDNKFPAPISTRWEEQPLASGLNGIPVLASYRLHTWNWPLLDGEFAQMLFDIFDDQQAGTSPAVLETDPYDASLYNSKYGTYEYSDFVILSISPRTRGLPFYDDVSVVFEVYVP